MNSQNAHKYLKLIQALIDGKTLQIDDGTGWIDLSENINFVFDPEDYRIKPEPRTFKMWLYHPMGRMYPFVEDEKQYAENHEWELITVQEVLK